MRKILGVLLVTILATTAHSQTSNLQNEQWSGIAFQEASIHAERSVLVWKLNFPSKPELEAALLRDCNNQSNAWTCQMLVSVRRACGALAITSNWKGWGRGYGEDYKSAQFDAVNNCQRGNPEGDCSSIRWVCAYALTPKKWRKLSSEGV